MRLNTKLVARDERHENMPNQIVLKDYYRDEGPKNNQLELVEKELNVYLKNHPEHYEYLNYIVNSDCVFHRFYSRIGEENFCWYVENNKSQKQINRVLEDEFIKNWKFYLVMERNSAALLKQRTLVWDSEDESDQKDMDHIFAKLGLS